MSIRFSIDGDIAWITIDRDAKRNAFNADVVRELTEAFTRLADQPGVRAAVLAGAGKHFSAGADLAGMRAIVDHDHADNVADARRLSELMTAIDQCPCPVVARVQGAAFGGALGLICAADIAVAADDARLCLSEVRLGIVPAVIAPYVVRALGARQSRRYFMTAEQIPAERAEQLSLVHQVVPRARLDDAVEEQLKLLRAGAPEAQLRTRELVTRASQDRLDDTLREYTAELIAETRASDEGREGLNAFLEQRNPAWRED